MGNKRPKKPQSDNTDFNYTVDSNGEIELPHIGAVKVAGLTHEIGGNLSKPMCVWDRS